MKPISWSTTRRWMVMMPFIVLLPACAGGGGNRSPLFPEEHKLTLNAKAMRNAYTEPLPWARELDKTAVPPLVLEPGDLFTITAGTEGGDISKTYTVPLDGIIDLGAVGRIFVIGLTVEQTENLVHERLRAKHGTKDWIAKVELSLQSTPDGSRMYYVLGDVKGPNAYPLRNRATVLDAIVQAGGLNRTASHRDIILVRPTPVHDCRLVLPVCYDDIVQLGDVSTNYQLMPGDRIYVPSLTFRERLCGPKRDKKYCGPCGRPQHPCPVPEHPPQHGLGIPAGVPSNQNSQPSASMNLGVPSAPVNPFTAVSDGSPISPTPNINGAGIGPAPEFMPVAPYAPSAPLAPYAPTTGPVPGSFQPQPAVPPPAPAPVSRVGSPYSPAVAPPMSNPLSRAGSTYSPAVAPPMSNPLSRAGSTYSPAVAPPMPALAGRADSTVHSPVATPEAKWSKTSAIPTRNDAVFSLDSSPETDDIGVVPVSYTETDDSMTENDFDPIPTTGRKPGTYPSRQAARVPPPPRKATGSGKTPSTNPFFNSGERNKP